MAYSYLDEHRVISSGSIKRLARVEKMESRKSECGALIKPNNLRLASVKASDLVGGMDIN